jgi:hypothetical protein
VAVREFILKPPHGWADYLLFVDGQAVGRVEGKPAGTTLTGVEMQSAKYGDGLPDLTCLFGPAAGATSVLTNDTPRRVEVTGSALTVSGRSQTERTPQSPSNP